MSEFWFTSDQHFSHKLVVGLRGFDTVEEHDETIIDAWNSRVKPGDVVYTLGDFMLTGGAADTQQRTEVILRRLRGTKNLIRGNHDRPPVERAKGWAWVGDYRHKRIRSGFHVVLFHYAMRSWGGMHYGYFHLYGHSHGQLAGEYGRSMDVGVDTRADFTPWHFEEVYTLMESAPVLQEGHHVAE